jgi:hypothetical protein
MFLRGVCFGLQGNHQFEFKLLSDWWKFQLSLQRMIVYVEKPVLKEMNIGTLYGFLGEVFT